MLVSITPLLLLIEINKLYNIFNFEILSNWCDALRESVLHISICLIIRMIVPYNCNERIIMSEWLTTTHYFVSDTIKALHIISLVRAHFSLRTTMKHPSYSLFSRCRICYLSVYVKFLKWIIIILACQSIFFVTLAIHNYFYFKLSSTVLTQ